MSNSLCYISDLVLSLHLINEHFICFSSKCHKSSAWAHLNGKYFVWIIDLSNWIFLVTIPEVDWGSLATGHQFKLIIFSLRHAIERSVLSLMPIHSFFLLQIICWNGTIHWARMNQVRLIQVWKKTHDIFFLICKNLMRNCTYHWTELKVFC